MPRREVKSTNRREYELLISMVAKARIEAGFSQGELARKTGISQPTISDIESGKRRLDLVELLDILKALELAPLPFVQEFLSLTN